MNKQLPMVFYKKKGVLKKFQKIYRKTSVLECLIFNKALILRSLRKKRLRLRFFPIYSVKFLYTFFQSDYL